MFERVEGRSVPVLKHSTRVGVLVHPLLDLSGSHSRGRQDAGVVRIRALRTVLTMLGHGVGQVRDAGDETEVQLVAVVVL